jgi:hypothetical protein
MAIRAYLVFSGGAVTVGCNPSIRAVIHLSSFSFRFLERTVKRSNSCLIGCTRSHRVIRDPGDSTHRVNEQQNAYSAAARGKVRYAQEKQERRAKQTLSRVKKEMALPRIAKSARKKDANQIADNGLTVNPYWA